MDIVSFGHYLIIFSLVSLTTIFVIIGIWVIKILKEFFRATEAINGIIKDGKSISRSIVVSINEFSNFLLGLKSGLGLLNKIPTRNAKKKTK